MVGCYPIPRGCRKTSDGYALPTLFYMMGQPLGSLGSWPAFALCHHWVIQFCAQRAYGTFGFKDYALLGDDVCIADDKMAKELYSLMCALGVKIAWEKSWVSYTGAFEMAKLWSTKGMWTSVLFPLSLFDQCLCRLRYFTTFPLLSPILTLISEACSDLRTRSEV